ADQSERRRISSRSSNDDPDDREFDALVTDRGEHMGFGPVPEQAQDFVQVAELRELANSVGKWPHVGSTRSTAEDIYAPNCITFGLLLHESRLRPGSSSSAAATASKPSPANRACAANMLVRSAWSWGGETSTRSIPTIFAPARLSSKHNNSRVLSPPGTGVPVPGQNAGSTPSTSTLRYTGRSPIAVLISSA